MADGKQLLSYIAPAAPATRRPATGGEPFLRPEVGFTPKWYRAKLGIDFGERWHADPAYRRETVLAMREELERRFPGTGIGGVDRPAPLDLLTGAYGVCPIAAIYGSPLVFAEDGWPETERRSLGDEEVDRLEPPELEENPFFRQLEAQAEWIAQKEGRVEGYLNWQGVLNNAHRLRGETLFLDLATAPERARHLFECLATTMVDAARRLYALQEQSGVRVQHFTVSNCLVNLVSPESYRDQLLEWDRRLAGVFGLVGVHNCAWTIDGYVPHYATISNIGYVDMGLSSDLVAARNAFPAARRALMYTPMDLAAKSLAEIESDLERVASELGPCDVVFADVEEGTPDERVLEVTEICRRVSQDR